MSLEKYCKKAGLDLDSEPVSSRDAYIAVIEYNLKRKDRLIAEQGNQVSILNELAQKRNGDYDALKP